MFGINWRLNFQKNLTGKVWDVISASPPPGNPTMEKALDLYAEEPSVAQNKTRISRIRAVKHTLKKYLSKPINALTFANLQDWQNSIKSDTSRITYRGVFFATMVFIRDGKVKVNEKHNEQKDPNSITIKQAEYIDEAEALALISNSRGKHSEFRQDLLEKILAIPEGKSYAFVPENLPEDKVERAKSIASLNAAIGNLFMMQKLQFRKNYIASKNLFIISRRPTKTTKGA